MKKILTVILAFGIIVGLSNTVFAFPTSITVDGLNDAGSSYSDGFKVFFETGTYTFIADSGGWSTYNIGTQNLGYRGWLWSMNIYQENGANYYLIGDDSTAYSSASAALTANSAATITINQLSDGYLWFYVKDPSPHENTGLITASIAVVPEPISSALFIIGGVVLGGRSYIKRKKAKARI